MLNTNRVTEGPILQLQNFFKATKLTFLLNKATHHTVLVNYSKVKCVQYIDHRNKLKIVEVGLESQRTFQGNIQSKATRETSKTAGTVFCCLVYLQCLEQ